MPATPATWRNAFGVAEVTTGSQTGSRVITLNNGNILVVWTSSADTGAGSSGGLDIIGRIFDPLGEPVTAEFSINNGYFVDDESDVDITPLGFGGFMAVYVDDDGSTTAIRMNEFMADGTLTHTDSVAPQLGSGSANGNPVVASSSTTSTLVVWERTTSGDGEIWGRLYDAANDTFGTEFLILSTALGDLGDPQVTVLTNGNYVILARDTEGDSGYYMRILDSAGANVLGFTEVSETLSNDDVDFDATVTALTGGGFVVSFSNTDATDTDLYFQVFNAAGAATSAISAINAGPVTNAIVGSQIVALPDGGFVVVYDNNETNALEMRRYDSSGSPVGDTFVAVSGGGPILSSFPSEISVTALNDGRFAMSYTSSFLGDSNVYMEIFDVRDAPSGAGSYFTGTAGDDVISTGSSRVGGGAGNDTINEVADTLADVLDGGDGDDVINVRSLIAANGDIYRGAAGVDTINWTNSGVAGGVFDLLAGTATAGGNTETMSGFENLTATTGADTVGGTDATNIIYGLAGNDIINTLGGADTVYAGDGSDMVNLGTGADRLYGGAGNDTAHGDDGDDNIRGEAGNDILRGEVGDDTLYGGDDTDSLYGGDGIDRAYGGFGNDSLYGDGGDDSLRGEDGDDLIWGHDGVDFAYGDAGEDRLDGGAGSDVMYGGVGDDRIYGGDDGDRLYGQGSDDQIWGGGGNDTISGNNHDDIIRGEDGNDTIRGDEANDTLYGQEGNDTLYGGIGVDRTYGGNGADQIYGGDDDDQVYGDGDNDSVRGEDGNDQVYGGSGDDFLYGGNGNDRLEGGAGVDRLYGQAGADTFWFDDTHLTAPGPVLDRIQDFSVAQGDIIDLSAIDANTNVGGDQAFTKVAAFTGVAGQYVLQTSSGYVTALFDTNGDGAADLALRVDGVTNGLTNWIL